MKHDYKDEEVVARFEGEENEHIGNLMDQVEKYDEEIQRLKGKISMSVAQIWDYIDDHNKALNVYKDKPCMHREENGDVFLVKHNDQGLDKLFRAMGLDKP